MFIMSMNIRPPKWCFGVVGGLIECETRSFHFRQMIFKWSVQSTRGSRVICKIQICLTTWPLRHVNANDLWLRFSINLRKLKSEAVWARTIRTNYSFNRDSEAAQDECEGLERTFRERDSRCSYWMHTFLERDVIKKLKVVRCDIRAWRFIIHFEWRTWTHQGWCGNSH